MATVNVTTTAAIDLEPGRKYLIREEIEIFPLDSSSVQQRYVVRASDDRSYVVSEQLKRVLELLDGTRTLSEVAVLFSAEQQQAISGHQMSEFVSKMILPRGLVDEVLPASEENDNALEQKPSKQHRKRSFELVFRLPLISPKFAERFTDRLTWLFNPSVAIVMIAAVVFVQVAFLAHWFAPRAKPTFGPSDLLVDYAIILITALIHEFGHATACRKYSCEHGAIGFLLYMIFPSLYVNLSNAWRLPGKQRAIIDIGGVYFQLLTTIPLFLIFLITGDTHCAIGLVSVDSMVLLSLNPVLKFDGYWLLVDLSGLVNLRARGWRVVKEVVTWSFGLTKGVPILNEVSGRGKKLFLVTYSFITLALISSIVLLLIAFAPARFAAFTNIVHEIVSGPNKGAQVMIQNIGKLLMSLFFFVFMYRLLQGTVFRLFTRRRKNL